MPSLCETLRTCVTHTPPRRCSSGCSQTLGDHRIEHALLCRAVVDSPPHFLRDGGVIAPGYDPELDELRLLGTNTEQFLLDLERRERERTGSIQPAARIQPRAGFLHRNQPLAGGRGSQGLSTPPDCQIRRAVRHPRAQGFRRQGARRSRSSARPREGTLRGAAGPVDRALPVLQKTAAAIAELDVLTCFAERAATLDCVQPELAEQPLLHIEGGRHPVVERASRSPFIPNDVCLDESRRMLIITGPNMGGKSTYMRQTALIVILAHIGCFVPARRVRAGTA